MRQRVMTIAEYREESQRHKEATGRTFLQDHRVTCHAWPKLDPRFGQQVVTDKDFYSGVPDISEENRL